jgi:hypothetical protein
MTAAGQQDPGGPGDQPVQHDVVAGCAASQWFITTATPSPRCRLVAATAVACCSPAACAGAEPVEGVQRPQHDRHGRDLQIPPGPSARSGTRCGGCGGSERYRLFPGRAVSRGGGACYVWLPAGPATDGRVRRRWPGVRSEAGSGGGLGGVPGHSAVSGFGWHPLPLRPRGWWALPGGCRRCALPRPERSGPGHGSLLAAGVRHGPGRAGGGGRRRLPPRSRRRRRPSTRPPGRR